MKFFLSFYKGFFLLIGFTIQTDSMFDYNIYSQISAELDHSFDTPKTVLDYFLLNNQTLSEYNDYLYFSNKERLRLKEKTKSMFEFSYDNYMKVYFL